MKLYSFSTLVSIENLATGCALKLVFLDHLTRIRVAHSGFLLNAILKPTYSSQCSSSGGGSLKPI